MTYVDIDDLEAFDPRKTSNEELVYDFALVCGWYSSWKRLRDKFKYSEGEVLKAGKKVIKEIVRRVANGEMSFQFNRKKMKKSSRELFDRIFRELGDEEKKFVKINDEADCLPELIDSEHFPSMVWIPKFISISGSTIYARNREPKDTDVVVKAKRESDGSMHVRIDPSLNLKLTRVLQRYFGDRSVHYSATEYGPNWTSLPLYDLVLVPRPTMELNVVHEQEFAKRFYDSAGLRLFKFFRMLKPMHGRVKQEEYSIDSVIEVISKRKEDWYPIGIGVQRKYDGIHVQINSDGNRGPYANIFGRNCAREDHCWQKTKYSREKREKVEIQWKYIEIR